VSARSLKWLRTIVYTAISKFPIRIAIFRSAKVQFGGEDEVVLEVKAGEVVVIPAGVSHKNIGAGPDFSVVGAYPEGQAWDCSKAGPASARPRMNVSCRWPCRRRTRCSVKRGRWSLCGIRNDLAFSHLTT
jgi:hypothetical protein